MPDACPTWNLAWSCLVVSAETRLTSNPTMHQEFRLAWPRVSAEARNL